MNTMIPAWVAGELTAFDKIEAHRQGHLHKAVSVFLLHGDDLLIQQRAVCKYHTPGLWANTCCTHPHWGEAPEPCAHRRLYEELGLTGLALQHRDQITYHSDVGGGMVEHERVDIFIARVDQRLPVQPNPDEVQDTAWVNLDRLTQQTKDNPDRFTPWLAIYLDQHADQIFAASAV